MTRFEVQAAAPEPDRLQSFPHTVDESGESDRRVNIEDEGEDVQERIATFVLGLLGRDTARSEHATSFG